MKLNDPFGRMESRHQAGYESMCATMRKSGIDTPSAASEVISQSKKHALKYIGVGIAVLLLMTLLLPRAMPVTLSLAIFLVVWIINSTLNGQRYIKRYVDEELK
jgi:hypothetical protein